MSALPFEYNASWERLVSDILSPPVVWALLAFPLAFRSADNAQQALTWALTYITLVCVLPIVYIALMVKRGSITDIHMPVRNQRIRPFLVSILCTMFAWGILRLMGAPAVMPLLALFSMVQLAIMLIITFTWQISIHAISISGAMMSAGNMPKTAPSAIVTPLVSVARRLR